MILEIRKQLSKGCRPAFDKLVWDDNITDENALAVLECAQHLADQDDTFPGFMHARSLHQAVAHLAQPTDQPQES